MAKEVANSKKMRMRYAFKKNDSRILDADFKAIYSTKKRTLYSIDGSAMYSSLKE